jgi:hypothetical protein
MPSRKRIKAKKLNLFQKTWKLHNNLFKWLFKWFLRSLLVVSRRGRQTRLSPKSGFVLPTATMVLLVAVLLITATLFRSFDRSSNASNTRVNLAVLKAAEPGLDRARAKIDALFNDPTLPRETPSDLALYNALQSNRYNLGDEARLKLVSDIDRNNTIEANATDTIIENDETLTTAWKFPVDTDNNGKFDSYTLYGIYFRSPSRDANGKFSRSRNSLEARTPPMSGGTLGNQCANLSSTSASLIGDSSWYKTGEKLTKSVFVYTATVPITNAPSSNYEVYKGNKGFSALEFQQDRSRLPLTNNAAIFQDDLELTPGSTFRMNGKIFTNANLLIGGRGSTTVRLYQVSSKNSCFYKEQNSKITVGGNVGTGNLADTTDQAAVTVDLFKGVGNGPGSATINGSNRSTTSAGGAQVGYNDAAYNQRIALMKQAALSYSTTNPPTVTSIDAVTQYPEEVKKGFRAKITAPGGSSLNVQEVLAEQIETYLKDRTRRVPYAEVAFGANAVGSYTITNVFASGIEPRAAWREPSDTNTGLSLNTANLKQTQPEKQRKDEVETELGDRIYVGNNLPAYWKNDSGKYVTGPFEKQFLDSSIKWTNPNTELRYRNTQVVTLPEVGESGRDGYWEEKAAEQPATNVSDIGGLRVITGAGIYRNSSSGYTALSTASFMSAPTALDAGGSIPNAPLLAGESTATQYSLVWPDTMPMKGGADDPSTITVDESTASPDLRMRATAVYHYANNAGISQTPIACVSSYYDPTDSTTAKNGKYGTSNGFPWGTSGTNLPYNNATGGRSNNGVVYPAPYTSDSARFTAIASYLAELKAQAKLMYPNGRIVSEPLQRAIKKINASGGLANTNKPLSLAENSAIDTAICSIKILTDSSFSPSTTPPIPHGAIKEATFLDARQVKAIDKTATNYDLELEQRQPLEVRVTDINLDADNTKGITKKSIGTNEYILPNSGIIYATRDDALLDLSDTTAEQKLLSPTDFKLDPTRRPNGIRLIEGKNLERDDDYREEEKGLILVTNLPAYIKGDFNLHQKSGTTTATEEFTDKLENDWSDFYTRNTTLDNNFACRKGQTGCGSNGDQWRPATIISDSITVLSNSFVEGFRNQGDYDLRNNSGSSVTQARKKNGFWDNNFITSAWWWDTANTDNAYPAEKTTNSYVSSYVTNGVTPVQRRVDFPEYVMEVCRKIPISTCTTKDWVVGFDQNGNGTLSNTELNLTATQAINLPAGALVSGTTAQRAGNLIAAIPGLGTLLPSTRPEEQRYPRRIAFKRNPSGTLALKEWNGEPTPIPLGVNSLGLVAEFPYDTYGTNAPREADNGLWFRTTTNTSGKPYENPSYQKNKPLAYTTDTELVSPPTPDISGIPSLNSPTGNPVSKYTICTDQNTKGSTNNLEIDSPSDLDLGKCSDQPGNPMAQINTVRNALLNTSTFGPDISTTDNIVSPTRSGTTGTFPAAAGTTTTFTSNPAAPSAQVVNVIDMSGDFNTSITCTTIKLVGNENSVFVLRRTANAELSFGGSSSDCGVQVVLDGVDPNNVIWVINANVKWNAVNSIDASKHHKMTGTFITDSTGSPKWDTVDFDEGGRILGPNGVPSASNFTNSKIKAIPSAEQPRIVPVLQIHSPEGSPSSSLDQGSAAIKDNWLQIVENNTTVNAIFAAGNSPSRPQEESAGLHNFVRFLENWSSKTLNIKGSFMQFRRSAYATGPFATVLRDKATDNNGSLSIFGYSFTQYKTSNGTPAGTLPYYDAPTRQWGYDVGLLSQPLDKFAQRFTQQQTSPPDEFFREISQDDSWVQTLLCAAQGSGTSYTYAVDASERPTNCKAIGSYND